MKRPVAVTLSVKVTSRTTRHISMSLLALLFAAAQAFGQIAGEHEVAPPVYGAAPASATEIAAASDGVDYLVAWFDGGRGVAAGTILYAARVSADGTVIDRGGIRIASLASIGYGLNVVWAGDAYAIFWNDFLIGRSEILAARVNRDGVVVDPPRSLGDGFLQQGQVASNGERILMAWEGRGLSFVDRRLNVMDGPSPSSSSTRAIASNGSDFMILYADASNAYAGRVTAAGRFDPPQLLGPSPYGVVYSIASDGHDYVVAYSRSLNPTTSVIAVQHVSSSGMPDHITTISMSPLEASVGWSGGAYLLSTSTGTAWRIDERGELLPGGSVTLPSSVAATSVRGMLTSSRSEALLIWSTGSYFGPPVMAQRMSGGNALGNLIVAGQSANEQREPSIAFSGRAYATVWAEEDSVYLSRLSLDGTPLDGRGVRLGDGFRGSTPTVVFDGVSFVVAWVSWQGYSHPLRLLIQRVSPDAGAPTEPPLVVAERGCRLGSISLSVGRNATLATWSDCDHVFAAALPQAGSLGAQVTLASGMIGTTSAGWNGNEWLVVWEDQFIYSSYQPTLMGANLAGARLTAAMTPLDATPIAIATGALQPNYNVSSHTQNAPQVASDGIDFLVAWNWSAVNFLDAGSPQVRLRFVTAGGTPLGETEGTRIDDGSSSAAVWDGTAYAILYSRAFSWQNGLFLARISRPAEAFAAGIMLAPSAATMESSLAVTGRSALTFVYTRAATDATYGGVGRAYVRSLGTPPRGRAARTQAQ